MLLHMGSGEDEAWQWFVERYDGFVRDVLRRRLPTAGLDEAVTGFWSFAFEQRLVQKHTRARRFRAFLHGCLVNYSHKQQATPRAEPRADQDLADLAAELASDSEVRSAWAENVLRLSIEALARHPKRSPHAHLLRRFYGIGPTNTGRVTGSLLAAELGIKPESLHVRLVRARKFLREHFRAEVLQTLSDEADLSEELGEILSALQQQRPGILDR